MQAFRAIALAAALRTAKLKRRSARPKVPPARWPTAARTSYLRGILALLADVEATVRSDFLPLVPSLLGDHARARGDRADALGDNVDEAMARVRDDATRKVSEPRIRLLVQDNALRVSEHTRKELDRQVNAVAKVNLFSDPQALANHIDAFVADNVRLIKSVAFDQLEDMKGIVLNGARQGLRHEVVQQQIIDRFRVSKRRAAVIARDQVGKLNGELAQLRQQQIGVRRYTWLGMDDKRERPGHRALNGTIQSWDAPPVTSPTGSRAHPGQEILCRCQPVPVIDDVLEDAGLLPANDTTTTPEETPNIADHRAALSQSWDSLDSDGGKAVRNASRSFLSQSFDIEPRVSERQDTLRAVQLPRGIAGVHHWDGKIDIAPDAARAAGRAFKQLRTSTELGARELEGLNTVMHEEMHGYGPLARPAYREAGKLIEETTTEILARKAVRRLAGIRKLPDNPSHVAGLPTRGPRGWISAPRAYDVWIAGLARDIENVTGWDEGKVLGALEQAAVTFKRNRTDISTPAGIARAWVDGVARLTADQRAELLQRVLDRGDML